jgi:hypothetical protein
MEDGADGGDDGVAAVGGDVQRGGGGQRRVLARWLGGGELGQVAGACAEAEEAAVVGAAAGGVRRGGGCGGGRWQVARGLGSGGCWWVGVDGGVGVGGGVAAVGGDVREGGAGWLCVVARLLGDGGQPGAAEHRALPGRAPRTASCAGCVSSLCTALAGGNLVGELPGKAKLGCSLRVLLC